jgi:lipopolysaccharide transport system ATP-binding protein
MGEVAHGGRTVLFVSHNMSAVVSLCRTAIWLEKGRVVLEGGATRTVAAYLEKHTQPRRIRRWDNLNTAPGNETVRMMDAEVRAAPGHDPEFWTVETPLDVVFRIWSYRPDLPMFFNFQVYNKEGVLVFNAASSRDRWPVGALEGKCRIPGHLLNTSSYTITFSANYASTSGVAVEDVLAFELSDTGSDGGEYAWSSSGVTRPQLEWQVVHLPGPSPRSGLT